VFTDPADQTLWAGAWRVTACEQNGSASSMVIEIPSHDPADEQREAVCST
jgi:hypothetical protein